MENIIGPVCPKDLRGCCDDICRGAGCIRLLGEPMIYWCKKCGEYSDSYWFQCECGRREDDEDHLNEDELEDGD